ncbi:hypothetical protein [Aureimonas pseudogalii]|uniref:Uncharacterized protein n=1 Tax=Aureimonas pseudogalii TaxID=1744844 RepID=A0A7W6EGK8_9HYPH|nr:hypothetical protein [Aureimonas pseudogalii]MBB3998385.1 hypothetical protein [Aureimonas pseudogalii]
MEQHTELDSQRQAIREAALNETIIETRHRLATFASEVFHDVGRELHVVGHLIGSDRTNGTSPFGHGDDATVAVSMLLRIGSELVSASSDLIADGRAYAGSALIRQLVEIEYLAWAFETKSEEAARWLRSTHGERMTFFTPAKLRKAADGRFRGVDYGYHCELGGHPVPQSWQLLGDDGGLGQLMLSDCLGHTGRIWDHVVRWAHGHPLGQGVSSRSTEMLTRFGDWKRIDPLTELPPPPEAFPERW